MSGNIYSIVGSSLDAQDTRMSAIASNLANVDSIAAPGGTPYRAHEVVFQAAPVAGEGGNGAALGVQVAGTVLSNAPLKQHYDPSSPYADSKGLVTGSNVSQVSQMVDLIDSSNTYSASVAVLQEAGRIDQQMLSSFQVT
ncbi:MAG: flagellar basal body rod protein FlgC [Rhodospirillales bacterium 20-64-7]|nr:MAG: flagellar basal body rod protein FlgC [Rhodospirillales bacterium 20-64-7]